VPTGSSRQASPLSRGMRLTYGHPHSGSLQESSPVLPDSNGVALNMARAGFAFLPYGKKTLFPKVVLRSPSFPSGRWIPLLYGRGGMLTHLFSTYSVCSRKSKGICRAARRFSGFVFLRAMEIMEVSQRSVDRPASLDKHEAMANARTYVLVYYRNHEARRFARRRDPNHWRQCRCSRLWSGSTGRGLKLLKP
jgi:hypothetical protein